MANPSSSLGCNWQLQTEVDGIVEEKPPGIIEHIFASQEAKKVSAISDIRRQMIIGVAAIGDKVKRYGFIDSLLISTDNANYVFCDNEWTSLKEILESRNIKKVMYGSPAVVDLLFKTHNIRLQAVEDLQFLELAIRHREQSLKGTHSVIELGLKKYSDCLQNYLGVEMSSNLCDENYLNVKATRPSELFDLFCKIRVKPLKQLRLRLLTKLFEDVGYSTKLFVSSLCDSSDAEYKALTELHTVNCSSFIQRRNQIPRILMSERNYSENITLNSTAEKSGVSKEESSQTFDQKANEARINFERVTKRLNSVSLSNCTATSRQVSNSNGLSSDDDCQIVYEISGSSAIGKSVNKSLKPSINQSNTDFPARTKSLPVANIPNLIPGGIGRH